MIPFSPLSLAIGLAGDLRREGTLLLLSFNLKDPGQLVLDSLREGHSQSPARADLLWQTTCWEAFVGVPGEAGYWEFNFASDGQRWNCYRFDSYRSPVPPRASDDFTCEKIEVSKQKIECRLRARVPVGELEASLCAVIRASAATYYFSTKHAGAKPDFHLRAGWNLRR